MPQPKDITVTVTVDTDNITQANVTETIVLTDNNNDHDTTSGDSSTFDIIANDGATITFQIAQKNEGTGVSFVSFDKEHGGSAIMDPLPSSPNWVGTINGAQQAHESYSITVDVPGKGQFTLDPEVHVEGP